MSFYRTAKKFLTGKKLPRHPDLGITVCSFLFILGATLYPFDFSIQEDSFFHQLLGSLKQPSNLADQVANVLLFLPLGFGLNWLLTKRMGLKKFASLIITLAVSFWFSLSIELLQTFLPTRTSSLSDVLTNTVGGGLGGLSFYWWIGGLNRKIYWLFQASLRKLTIKQLTIGFIGYLLFISLIAIGLQNITNLNSWDTNFPLLIGNERTGDRPWRGTVFDVAIADKAITDKAVVELLAKQPISTILKNSLLTEYSFARKGAYLDLKGRSPDLVWHGSQQSLPDSGISLSSQGWLETVSPAEFINQQIQKTSQFTLSLIVAAANINQDGPARIFSLSQDPFNRNLTIGQEGQNLVIRLRTSFSGQNGAHPEIYVEKVFTDTAAHHLIVTYGSSMLRVYVDNVQRLETFELTPDAAFLSYLLPPKIHQGKIAEIFHSLLTFAPLAFLLALITTFIRGNLIFYGFLTVGGVLLPVLLLELLWVSKSYQSIRIENLLLSISIFFVTFVATKLLIKWSFLNPTESSA